MGRGGGGWEGEHLNGRRAQRIEFSTVLGLKLRIDLYHL